MKSILRIIDLSQTIKKITFQGIHYTIDDVSYFIAFSDCHESYLSTINDIDALEIARKSKRVGQRNILNEPPYIEFFTAPRIRFAFESIHDFHEVRHRIRKMGWTTMDLT